MHFFSIEGQPIAAIEAQQSPRPMLSPAIRALLREVVRDQQPLAAVDCRQQCLQRAYVPVIAADGNELIVNINRSIALVVQDFFNFTHADIALLRETPNEANQQWDVLIASNAATTHARVPGLMKRLPGQADAPPTFVGVLEGE